MKFLVFQHVPHEHPGLISDFAQERGIKLNIVEFWKPYKIPPLTNHDALIIMGGPMGVYEAKDVFPSKDEELSIIKKILGKIPIFGFCLGSQLLAYALGAAVHPNIKNGKHIKEIGYYNVDLTKEGMESPIFRGFPQKFEVLQWHGDAFDLPKDTNLLASSTNCTNQVFSFHHAYGILFHLEFKPEMVEKQIEFDRQWIHKDFEIDEQKLLAEAKQKESLMRAQSETLLNNFLDICKT